MNKNLIKSFFLLLLLTLNFHVCYAVLGTDQISSRKKLNEYTSPTFRFKSHNSWQAIENLFQMFHATPDNKILFERIASNEVSGFFGYHASASEFRIFQDVIRIAIEEYLNIPIRADFQFLRVPGSPELTFNSQREFKQAYPDYDDQDVTIQPHLLSLNIALYYSLGLPLDFSPRFFLQNASYKKPIFEEKLEPFFRKLGMGRLEINAIFQLARSLLPSKNGIILQFFDMSHEKGAAPYAFVDEQAYEGNRYAPSNTKRLSSYYLFYSPEEKNRENHYWIPMLGNYNNPYNQNALRLVMSNKNSINPNSPLVILRYHSVDSATELKYETALREYMRALPFNQEQAGRFREQLLNLWNS